MTRRFEVTPGSTAGACPLGENEAMALRRRRLGTVVRVHRGTVLVTQEGDLEDHVLEPGDELLLARRGRAVAWAFTEATISVCDATPEGPTGTHRARAARLRSAAPALGAGERDERPAVRARARTAPRAVRSSS